MNCLPKTASSQVPQVTKPRSGKRSREKGKRGERQWRDVLRAEGFHARRGQQFAGGADSPDVVCEELRGFHFEVKAVERLNIESAMDQSRRDAGRKLPLVAHRRSHRRWLVTMVGFCVMISPETRKAPAFPGLAVAAWKKLRCAPANRMRQAPARPEMAVGAPQATKGTADAGTGRTEAPRWKTRASPR